jgi:hypothetical protein
VERTDGFFLWPEGLAHYVRDHSVRLPDEVISHITEQRLAEAAAPQSLSSFLMHDYPSLMRHYVDHEWWRSQGVLHDPGPLPTQADLDAVIGGSTSVVVRSVPDPDSWHETENPADLDSLRDALQVVDLEMPYCMCVGMASFDFRRDGERLGIVTLHHVSSIRWDPFLRNAHLADCDPILDWLAPRGIPGYP